jgi:hypothetical protein
LGKLFERFAKDHCKKVRLLSQLFGKCLNNGFPTQENPMNGNASFSKNVFGLAFLKYASILQKPIIIGQLSKL